MPTVIIPDKICPHCGGVSWMVSKTIVDQKIYTTYRCKNKKKEYAKKWLDKVKDSPEYKRKAVKRSADYYKKHIKLRREQSKNYRLVNKKTCNKSVSICKKRNRSDIADWYIKDLLKKSINRQIIITPQQIQQYRQHLKIFRLCKKTQQQK